MSNKLFNCTIANDEFSSDFIKEIKKFSPYPILKVYPRTKGITACESGNCYWASSIISQTFGGKLVNGYMITPPRDDDYDYTKIYLLQGHGCWLTPEGTLVDVSRKIKQEGKKFRYFLPTDEKLILNGSSTEIMRDIFFPLNEEALKVGILMEAEKHREKWNMNNEDNQIESREVFAYRFKNEEREYEYLTKYLNKPLLLDGMNAEFINRIFPYRFSKKDRHILTTYFEPFIKVVNGDTHIKRRMSLFPSSYQEFALDTLRDAMKMNKNIFEFCYENNGLDFTSPIYAGKDETFSNNRINNKFIDNKSLATGKKIDDYPLHEDVIRSHQIPKCKQTKNVIKKRVAEINRYSKKHLSYKDYLILSNPYLFPHPSLINKLGKTLSIIFGYIKPLKRLA